MDFQDFGELYKNMRQIEKEENFLPPIINYKEFESWFSLIISMVIVGIMALMIYTNDGNLDLITTMSQNMLLYIISGLIAMLGFIVAGLAIMLSTTSNAVLNSIIKENKMRYLLSVFASFVYIAVVMVALIILCMSFYFALGINYPFVNWLYLFCSFVLIYTFLFTLFYIVSLLGTCINIFVFNFNVIEEGGIVRFRRRVREKHNIRRRSRNSGRYR